MSDADELHLCDVILDDGTVCGEQAVPGYQFCSDHMNYADPWFDSSDEE